VSRRADGTLFYCTQAIQQVILIPAWKLLRPGTDPIACSLPEDARLRMLELDPFIQNLTLFFPDSGAELSQASNPYADPSPNNRAELIGRWWLDTGGELSYSQGESHQLFLTQTNEVQYKSKVTINANVGVDYDGISLGLGVDASSTTSVGYQSSKETDAFTSKSAACFLIHNQNDRDLDGIELYYDKIFSTFMFRRVRARPCETLPQIVASGIIEGTVTNVERGLMSGLTVSAVAEDGMVYRTATRANGAYSFYNLPVGAYALTAGDRTTRVKVTGTESPLAPRRVDLNGVRRSINFISTPVWEFAAALGVPEQEVRAIAGKLPRIKNDKDLAKALRADRSIVARWRRTVVFPWKPQPRRRSGRGRKQDKDDDGRRS
jgi:hypothetical protein